MCISILWSDCWIGFGVGTYPNGLLKMIVSLEQLAASAVAE
jgi:hypothetical protein